MRLPSCACSGILAAVLFAVAAPVAAQTAASTVATNDNRRPAGTLSNRVLTLALFAGEGEWRPAKESGPALTVAAFGVEGGPLQIPGPLVRVPEGTTLIVRVRNGLTSRLDIRGLVPRPAASDAVLSIPAGETREVRFAAGRVGTYHYWATVAGSPFIRRTAAESQLAGAFIVDPRGDVPPDRVFVMTQWDDRLRRNDEVLEAQDRLLYAINGLTWPHTERLDEEVGRAARWHLVNLTQGAHPIHLHGFYFSVRGMGDGNEFTPYAAGQDREVVTQALAPETSIQMTWTPDRPGNWLMHCHMIAHVSPLLRFWDTAASHADHAGHGSHDPATAMSGLVLGIRVAGEPVAKPATAPRPSKRLTLTMHRRIGYWNPEDAYGFVLSDGEGATAPDDVKVPGPLLVLTRGEPVEITLKNELPEATAIHWHGIELDSYYDGVPGWSGTSASTTPAVDPGGSFVVRFTPTRAGTFIYHTHAHDNRQLASGLYGPIVVLEPGETFDATRDHIVLLGMEGTKSTQTAGRVPVVINGDRRSELTLKAGVPNRLRLINITANNVALHLSMLAANEPILWTPVAKDGAALPASQRLPRRAWRQQVSVGETYDFLVEPVETPVATQTFLELRTGAGQWVQQARVRLAR